MFLFGLLPFFFPVDIFVIVFVFAFLFFQSTFLFLLFLSFFFSSPHFCCCYCFVVGFVFVFRLFYFFPVHILLVFFRKCIYIHVCCRLDHEYVARGYFFHKGRMKVMVSKIYRVSYPTFCCIFFMKKKKG